MKRNPRWMMSVAFLVVVLSWLPGQALAQSGPFRLPEGGDTIGDPDMPGGSMKMILGRNLPELQVPLLVQAGGYLVVLRVPTTLLRLHCIPHSSSTHMVAKR